MNNCSADNNPAQTADATTYPVEGCGKGFRIGERALYVPDKRGGSDAFLWQNALCDFFGGVVKFKRPRRLKISYETAQRLEKAVIRTFGKSHLFVALYSGWREDRCTVGLGRVSVPVAHAAMCLIGAGVFLWLFQAHVGSAEEPDAYRFMRVAVTFCVFAVLLLAAEVVLSRYFYKPTPWRPPPGRWPRFALPWFGKRGQAAPCLPYERRTFVNLAWLRVFGDENIMVSAILWGGLIVFLIMEYVPVLYGSLGLVFAMLYMRQTWWRSHLLHDEETRRRVRELLSINDDHN